MEREFVPDDMELARWLGGDVVVHETILAEDIPAFIAWLQEGPPQLKWRITRELDVKPTAVHFLSGWLDLTDDDVERVTK